MNCNRQRGRPPLGGAKVSTYLSEPLMAEVVEVAQREHITPSAVVRLAVTRFFSMGGGGNKWDEMK